jgi:hypothetical protein
MLCDVFNGGQSSMPIHSPTRAGREVAQDRPRFVRLSKRLRVMGDLTSLACDPPWAPVGDSLPGYFCERFEGAHMAT